MIGKYKVITLCGSTRFKDAFIASQKRLTLDGNIVISVGLFGHSGDNEVWEGMSENTLTRTKEMLDDMHLRKIDMADEIFVINVGGYIGSSTRSEIEYALAAGKAVQYLQNEPNCEQGCYIPVVDMEKAISKLKVREKDIRGYCEIMIMAEAPDSVAFQKKYNAFYRVRRNEAWREEYFKLMSAYRERGNAAFGVILLRMYQATGQIEPSFSSKMLATLDAGMPIWDSNILKALHLRLKGSNPELRISNAVVLYDRICRWYTAFLKTEEAQDMIQRFDLEFPEFQSISPVKKIDFILWASQ